LGTEAEFDFPFQILPTLVFFLLFVVLLPRSVDGECTTETQETVDDATGGGLEGGEEENEEDAKCVGAPLLVVLRKPTFFV
jgi:hypothetical protein